jgi:hypothetical protein
MESKNVLLIFNQNIMYNPDLRLATEFNIIFNIMEAKICPNRGSADPRAQRHAGTDKRGIDYLESERVQVEYSPTK